MVFQKGHPIKIWGKAKPGEAIEVRFSKFVRTTTAAPDSSWLVSFEPQNLPGPYTIQIVGTNSILLQNVGVGQVWVCSGQSNMEWTLRNCKGLYDTILKRVNNNQIRLIKVKNVSSGYPLSDIESERGWQVAAFPNIMEFSAVAYFFAQEILTSVDGPIGLISSNWGGSPAEVWMSSSALASFPELRKAYSDHNESLSERKERQKLRDQRMPKLIQTAMDADTIPTFEKLTTNLVWRNATVPGLFSNIDLQNFDGIVWFHKTFSVTGCDGLKLHLGKIDDADRVYVNGVLVGSTTGYNTKRVYTIPSGLCKPGINHLVVQLLDHGGDAGFSSDSIYLSQESKPLQLLNGIWEYKIGYNFASNPDYIEPDWTIISRIWQLSGLYNGMIAPLFKVPIKGVIWYQGESNAGRAYQYRALFPALINDWRSRWNMGLFPFLYVQLANFLKPDIEPRTDPWPELREAQAMALSVPNTGMATAIDLGEENDIHPANKATVGKRLGLLARQMAYNQMVPSKSPTFKSMAIQGNKVRIHIETNGSKLVSKNGPPQEFVIAGANKKFVRANAKIEGNTILIWHPSVKEPVAVRYAWANNPSKANIYNSNDLPLVPFRTDQWKGCTEGVTSLD